LICAAVRAGSTEEALAEMEEARLAGADLCELRLDYVRDPDLPRLLAGRRLPVVATVRPTWEGGRFEGVEAERLKLLEEACRLGAEYVDYESRAEGRLDPGGAKLILSFHDFEKTPGDLEETASRMRARGPFVVKAACLARGAADLARLVRLQLSLGSGSAVVAMGGFGEPLRVLHARYGGWLTYASVRSGAETAPGQLTVGDLVGRYRVRSIDAQTELYGLIGAPGVPPWGADLFNEAFRGLGRNARCVRIGADGAPALMDLEEAMGLRGLSAAGGAGDFLRRAERQFQAWTGGPIPEAVLREFGPTPRS
jgi:3-dehydroquinate dehydratase/shikimate dehydrogenase